VGRINKTGYYDGWGMIPHKKRELSRSFDTLDEAREFAEGKEGTDIYSFKGKFKVTWIKIIQTDLEGKP